MLARSLWLLHTLFSARERARRPPPRAAAAPRRPSHLHTCSRGCNWIGWCCVVRMLPPAARREGEERGIPCSGPPPPPDQR